MYMYMYMQLHPLVMIFYRIDHLSHSKDNCVTLYHFVECLGSCSADPGVIFRRLLKKVTV